MALFICFFAKIFNLLYQDQIKNDFSLVSKFLFNFSNNYNFLLVWLFALPKQIFLSKNGLSLIQDLSDIITISR